MSSMLKSMKRNEAVFQSLAFMELFLAEHQITFITKGTSVMLAILSSTTMTC